MVNNTTPRLQWVARFPYWVVLLSTLLMLVTITGAQYLTFTTDFRTYFSSDNPQLKAFEQLEADFNKQDTLIFLVQPENPQSSIYTPTVFSYLQQLTQQSWQIPYARRVDSLINYQRIESRDDELIIDDLVRENIELTPSVIAEIKSYVKQQPRLINNLVSEDGDLSIVVVSLTLPKDDETATKVLVTHARDMLEKLAVGGIKVELFGTTVINLALAEAVERDMAMLIPLSYLLIFVAIFLLSRSLVGSLLALAMTLLTVATVFGVLGWFGKPLTPVVGAVPSMIMIIVIADCMHILVSFQHYLREGLEKRKAVMKAININFKPVLVTSITTAMGLLCLNFSESPPYRDLGNLVAMGALIAGVLALTWFPALLTLLPAPKNMAEAKLGNISRLLKNFSVLLMRYPSQFIAAAIFTLVVAMVGLLQLEFNEQWHQYYDESFAVRQALDTQNEKLYGVNFIQYSVESGEADGIYAVDYQRQLDALVNWIAQFDKVGYVDAISAQVKELNQKLQADQTEYYKIPEQRELIAQSLLAYEMSLPLGMGMEQYINMDRSATRLTVYLHKSTSKELLALDQEILSYTERFTPALKLKSGTGLDMVFAQISDRNSLSLLKGTGLALVLISLLLVVLFKSFRLGVISIVPNLLPIIVAYGFWGLISGHVDLGLSIVACMGLGLVVDDTIHFLAKYRYAREQNKTIEQAIQYAFSTVGVAMIITTLVLFIGFSLLALSAFSPTHGMGALLALTAICALIIDFIFLPLLLMRFDKK